MQSGRLLVNGSNFYCGNSSSSPLQLALKSQIPDVSGFATSAELNSLKTSVSNGKSLIASAITGKGISTASDATFQTMANNIGSIQTGVQLSQMQLAQDPISLVSSHNPTGYDGKTETVECIYGTCIITLTSNRNRIWSYEFDLSTAHMKSLILGSYERQSKVNYGSFYFLFENLYFNSYDQTVTSPTSVGIGGYGYNPSTKKLTFSGYDGSSYSRICGAYIPS